jgi:hypothetical protein
MPSSSDRAARVDHANALGRAAYRLARAGKITGMLRSKARRSGSRNFDAARSSSRSGAWRPVAFETEFSRLRVTAPARRSSSALGSRRHSVVLFRAGEWEGTVIAILMEREVVMALPDRLARSFPPRPQAKIAGRDPRGVQPFPKARKPAHLSDGSEKGERASAAVISEAPQAARGALVGDIRGRPGR